MNIRTRLTIRFTIIVATLASIFSACVYYFSSSYRSHQFYLRLEEKASNYAQLVLKLDDLNPGLVKVIDKNTAYLPNERIEVLDSKGRKLFSTFDDARPVNDKALSRIKKERRISYTEGVNEVYGAYYQNPEQDLLVIVSAYDMEGHRKLDNLRLILAVGLIVFILATLGLGWIFAGQALSPIPAVIRQVDRITASNLALRVDEGNGKDEVAQLAVTFNRMLHRIQQAFELQKSFVSSSSHELRTPLTSITGQLEVALMNEREPEEYRAVLSSLLEDIKSVNRLTNGLLELAQADVDVSRLKTKKIRIDELLLLTRNDILKRRPEYRINIDLIEFPEDEDKLVINCSEHLLRTVFVNIIENACKFSSNKSVDIRFKAEPDRIRISFFDRGIGISAEDLKWIRQPFFRGANAKGIPGHGLGLSLTYKVIEMHNAEIDIESQLNEYTMVRVAFPTA